MWYRVFGTTDAAIEPESLLAALRAQAIPVRGHFHVDDEGWFQADLAREDESAACEVQRYLASEDGFRALLNTWAAGVELIDTPHQTALMQHMISTRQIFTVRATQGTDELCRPLCVWLAEQTNGILQIDGEGYFSAAGERLARDAT